jgi:hypothetical protein
MSSTTDGSDLIASRDLVASAAQLLGLQLTSPRDTRPRVDPTAPVTLIDGSASSELQPLRNLLRCNLLAPLHDLTVFETS